VEECLQKSGIREGLCLVNAMHITASVFINDDERGLHEDLDGWLESLAPHDPVSRYRHNDTGEDNADAHLKRTVMGREVVVAVTRGKLDFGPWERIFYGEFDGRRKKRVTGACPSNGLCSAACRVQADQGARPKAYSAPYAEAEAT